MEVGGRIISVGLAIAAITVLLVGCGSPTSPISSQPTLPIQYVQPTQTGSSMSLETTQAQYVEGADGTIYSLQCLRTNAKEILQQGKTAMAQCASHVTATPGGRNNQQVQKTFAIYPPDYYQPQSYNSNFCSYIFTESIWNDNCISNYFGYSPSYGSYYNQSCNDCFIFGYTYLCISYCTQPGYYYPY